MVPSRHSGQRWNPIQTLYPPWARRWYRYIFQWKLWDPHGGKDKKPRYKPPVLSTTASTGDEEDISGDHIKLRGKSLTAYSGTFVLITDQNFVQALRWKKTPKMLNEWRTSVQKKCCYVLTSEPNLSWNHLINGPGIPPKALNSRLVSSTTHAPPANCAPCMALFFATASVLISEVYKALYWLNWFNF